MKISLKIGSLDAIVHHSPGGLGVTRNRRRLPGVGSVCVPKYVRIGPIELTEELSQDESIEAVLTHCATFHATAFADALLTELAGLPNAGIGRPPFGGVLECLRPACRYPLSEGYRPGCAIPQAPLPVSSRQPCVGQM